MMFQILTSLAADNPQQEDERAELNATFNLVSPPQDPPKRLPPLVHRAQNRSDSQQAQVRCRTKAEFAPRVDFLFLKVHEQHKDCLN